MKVCRRCKQAKPLNQMKRDTRNNDGYSSFCKACHQAASVAWQKANPQKLNATRRARYARNKEQINEARRGQYNYAVVRWERIKRLYGVSKDWYEKQLAAQGDVCAICKRKPTEFKRAFSVDHDHACCPKTPTCGKCNRGILCQGCNTSIHLIERDRMWVMSAISYLRLK